MSCDLKVIMLVGITPDEPVLFHSRAAPIEKPVEKALYPAHFQDSGVDMYCDEQAMEPGRDFTVRHSK